MKHLNKYAITLALLLGAATGTWAQDDITVTKSGDQANQWQYTMPDIDVELTVNYFPTAAFSEGCEPAALEGVDPGTDAAIVSTGQSQQGTVLYYATTDAEATAPDYDADCWTTVVPTAAIVQGDIIKNDKVYVYYYIKGNDAPEGQAATAENTFNDTDILGPLTVTLNVNTVDLRPATQFTTDGGQATVTVDEQAIVTVDGQPTDNFMLKKGGRQTITIAAAEGYKIRTAKMGGAAIPAGEVTSSDLGKLLGEDGNLYANIAAAEAAGTIAVAKMVYVGSNAPVVDDEGKVYDRGLAIDLEDGNLIGDIPGVYTCCEPSPAQWNTIIEAAGGYQALSDGLRESGGNGLIGHYYSSGFPLCFDFNTGKWIEVDDEDEYHFRNIHAIAPAAALSGDDATFNDAKTVATYTMPDHDVTVKYLLARDLTQKVAFDGIPAEPVGVTMGADGNYQPDTQLNIQLNDAIAGANIIGADGLTVSYERQGDGDTWTTADDFLTNMQPGTYRVVASPTDKMSPYDGKLTSATFTLAVNIRLDETDDNSQTLTDNNGKRANVTLTRTLWTGSYNTFSVPFDIPADKYADYKLSGVKRLNSSAFDSSTGVLTLNFEDESEAIEAGKPYLVKVSEDVVNPVFNGVTISSTATTTGTIAVDFIPTLGATTITDETKSILFLGASNKLYHPSASAENQQMKGFRAYFQLKDEVASHVRAFSLDFGDGETTGIKAIDNFTISQSDNCYDLSGRKIVKSSNGKMAKGVYIVNGKKKFIK